MSERRRGETGAQAEPSRGLPLHIARWDLDKTYLRTEFDTFRDLVRTAFEKADKKITNPGASTLLREMVEAEVSVHILSGSPEQMRRRLERKLKLDGVRWDSFTLKPNLQNLLRLRFRAVRDQLGYKLPALLQARAAIPATREATTMRRETLFGDDAEADAFVYSLYADAVAGRVGEDTLLAVLDRGRVYTDVSATALRFFRMLPKGDIVERILIHLEKQTPPDHFRAYGSRAVPFYNYLQAAFVVFEDKRIDAEAVLRVAHELVVRHGFTFDSLARSYRDLARRGHLRGEGIEAMKGALEMWLTTEQPLGAAQLRAMVDALPALAEEAKGRYRDAPFVLPDYLALVGAHNPRARGR